MNEYQEGEAYNSRDNKVEELREKAVAQKACTSANMISKTKITT